MPAFFWDFEQRRFVVRYRRFGATYRSYLQQSSSTTLPNHECLTLEEGTFRLCRNVDNYQSTLRQIPEERRSHLNCGGHLKPRELLFNLLAYS